MLTALWGSIWAAVSAGIARIASWMRPIVTDTAVKVIEEAAKTPEYTATTNAKSLATPGEEKRVVETIKQSKLWAAMHKD